MINLEQIVENKIWLHHEEERLRRLLEHYPNSINVRELEKGDDLNIQGVNSQCRCTLEEKLKDVVAALERIADGTYAKCPCGKDIESGRINGHPQVKYCRKCQEEKEKNQPLRRGYW